MLDKFAILLASISILTLAGAANAEVVTKRTTVTTITPGSSVIDLSLLDHNNDGIVSRREIGDQLFSIYDEDHNDILDEREYSHIRSITVRPETEKRFVRSIDLDDDGYPDVTEYTYDTVADRTRLHHFMHETNGLSAYQFMNNPFTSLDADHSNSIARDEWYDAYMAQVAPLVNAKPMPANNRNFND